MAARGMHTCARAKKKPIKAQLEMLLKKLSEQEIAQFEVSLSVVIQEPRDTDTTLKEVAVKVDDARGSSWTMMKNTIEERRATAEKARSRGAGHLEALKFKVDTH